MAAQVKKVKSLVIFFLVLGLLLLSANGRLLKEDQKEKVILISSASSRFHGGEGEGEGEGVDSFEVGLKELLVSLGAVKNSGPSPGGGGHRFATLGGVKESGPSPGEGH